MKAIVIVLMAVLMFGLAASPIFSNELAFAQTEEEDLQQSQREESIEEKEAVAADKQQASEDRQAERQQASDDRQSEKQQSSEDRQAGKQQASEDIKAGKQQSAEDRQEREIISDGSQRVGAVEGEERKLLKNPGDRFIISPGQVGTMSGDQQQQFQDRFTNMSEDKQQQLQDRMDAMKEQRATITPSGDRAAMMDMTEEQRAAHIAEIKDQRAVDRESRQSMTTEQREELIEQQRADMEQRRATSVTPRDQLSLGISPEDVICSDGYEVVIKVTNGYPLCVQYDTAVLLVDRGIFTYPE